MKSALALFSVFLSALLVLSACAARGNTAYTPSPGVVQGSNGPMNPSGTPSPLNTSANPWTQVNPQSQAQYQAARLGAH